MKNKKKVLIPVISLVLVAAIGAGIWFGTRGSSGDPVFVFTFDNVGMTEFWGDSQESYGPVSSDNIQTVFLSDTQEVTEILVKEGDTVKEGDLLMSFDTTLSDLELERKRLEVEKLKLQLEDEQKELRKINAMKPMQLPPPMEEPEFEDTEPNLGSGLNAPYRISDKVPYDGSTPEKALICWVRGGTVIDGSLFSAILQQSEKFQNLNRLPTHSHASAPDYGDLFDKPADPGDPVDPDPTDPMDPDPTDPIDPDPTDPMDPDPTDPVDPDPTDPVDPDPTDPVDPQEPIVVNDCYVVFKVTAGDMSLGGRTTWQGLHIRRSGGFTFFDASAVPDHTLIPDANPDEGDMEDSGPHFDMGSGLTASQIAELRVAQQKKIKEAEFNLKMAEANYKIMLTELNDGKILAKFDGVVVSLLDPEEAKAMRQPMLKVSGGGGFYIEGSVSELTRDELKIGQQVDVNDWNTGMMYTGQVVSIGDFPSSSNSFGGGGNPNVTYYPFRVFVDESADLQAGSYVSMTYSSGGGENGVYLEKPFLRTEGGQSYVYVMGENDRLEKRIVTTGKSLWGSYMEVTSGLTAEDLIAFPYGKNVKPGARAVQGDMSDLYNG